MKICIIGGGNIGSALIEGLLRANALAPEQITVSDPSTQVLGRWSQQGLQTSASNAEAVRGAHIVFLCVKPHLATTVLQDIRTNIFSAQLLVSFVAGFTLQDIETITGVRPMIRVIPNTAMAVNASVMGVSSRHTSDQEQSSVTELLSKMGMAIPIDESLMNAFTVLGSCGTAFALRYVRACMTAGCEIGFKPDMARDITAQVLLGTAKLLLETKSHPETEIDKVTTPKGITIVGLNEMEDQGLSAAIVSGIKAAYRKMS
jgi:pyrroline-5-carboxylate reductase